ncbi:hypothetical protein [Alienimonas sp. DA493]|uniref:hypothetical protein n=1 Tax=Alienimonas sp. DA493 TaxID=3373605 RepID=UPI0037541FC9
MIETTPDELLAAMLAETATWRAVCDVGAGASLAEIQAAAAGFKDGIVDPAEVGAEDRALARVRIGGIDPDPASDDYLATPRASVRQNAPDVADQYTNGGATDGGGLNLLVELWNPRNDNGYLFARTIYKSLVSELLTLSRTSGRMELTSATLNPVEQLDPEENDGDDSWSADIEVRWAGAV